MSIIALPIAEAIATTVGAEVGAVATELFGTSVGSYLYGSAVAYTGTKVAEVIDEKTGITETASSYFDQAKAFYLAQELQDPNIFLSSQGRKPMPSRFVPDNREKQEILNNENIESISETHDDRDKVFATTSRREEPAYNYSPQDLLKVIYDISKKQSGSIDDVKTLRAVAEKYKDTVPEYLAPLANIVTKYVGDIDTDIKNNPKYQAVENIFNMKSKSTGEWLSVEKNYVNENGQLYFINELGNKLGSMQQGTRTDIYIPMVYGEYGGAQSRNFSPPIDIVDLVFFSHDLDFTVNGYLDYNSDLKLIARLNSLLDAGLVPAKSINLIKSIIVYFSTAGLMIDKIKGTAERPEDFTELNDDIFLDLRTDLKFDSQNQDQVDEINDLKQKFFIELDYAKDDVQISSGSFKEVQSENIINEIEFELENMDIQII